MQHQLAVVCLAAGSVDYIRAATGQIGALQTHVPIVEHVLMVERGSYGEPDHKRLRDMGWIVKIVDPIRTKAGQLNATRWKYTFTTMQAWNLTEYETVAFLDLDAMPVANIMGLFQFKPFAATRAIESFDGRFSSGVMVIKPDHEVYDKLVDFTTQLPIIDNDARFGDQGILNRFFRGDVKNDWHKCFTHMPAKWNWKYWNQPTPKDIKIAHLRPTPWSHSVLSKQSRMNPYSLQWHQHMKRVSSK